jgi:hypothetical protein
MGGAEVGGHNMINITIRELYYTFADFFAKTGIIFFRGEKNIFLRVQRCSLRVQRSSVGCSVAQRGKVAQKGAA